jgi:hypothetical protein
MSENSGQTPGEPTPGPHKETPDIVGELREMGQQLEAVFRAAVESERTKQLQRDLAGGFREMTHQVQSALKSVQENPRVQQAEERGREVFNQAQQSKVVQDVQETVISGIAQLNEQLRKIVDRLEHEPSDPPPSSVPKQDVKVETETPPATGDTTKLD